MRNFHRSIADRTDVAFPFLNKPQQQHSPGVRALLKHNRNYFAQFEVIPHRQKPHIGGAATSCSPAPPDCSVANVIHNTSLEGQRAVPGIEETPQARPGLFLGEDI